MKKLFIAITFLSAVINVKAQTKDRPSSIGIIGGLTQYNGDLGQGFYKGTTKAFGGIAYSRYISGHFDFAFNASMGRWGYEEKNKTQFNTKMMQANLHFRMKLVNSDEHKLVPYLFAGIGVADYSDYSLKTAAGINIDNPQGNGTDLFVPYGAGIQYRLTEKFNLSLQETFCYTDHDRRDGEEHQNNESFLMHTLGLNYNFGAGKDTDKDGVKDRKDNCPNTQIGVKVDDKGCPLDRDGDLVADFLDSCPDTKGIIALHGCPDKDGDGVADKDDQCPVEAGSVAAKGCPDKDNDGVLDKDDHCPDQTGSLENQGCPDKDEDGVLDADDACPDAKGTLALHGCADADNDGVADNIDKCPNEKGTVANNGCPDVNAAANLENLFFGSDKFYITKAHYPVLDRTVKLLNDNPLYKLIVEGHADNKGDAQVNRKVSENRANAAKKYLMKKGITADRIETKAMGETKPAESNDTEAGRAKNRRVELKVLLP